MDQSESKVIDHSKDKKNIYIEYIHHTFNIPLIKTKLQIIYTYSIKINKNFKTLLTECAEWDKDCMYALEHTSIHNLHKYI